MIVRNFKVSELEQFINWKMLLHAWGLHGASCGCVCETGSEAASLLDDARACLREIERSDAYDGFGLLRIVKAASRDNDLIVDGRLIPTLRQQKAGSCFRSIVDYVHSNGDYVGVFMVGAGRYIHSVRERYQEEGDSYRALLLQSLADRLAEASSEYLHFLVRREYWGYAPSEELDVERILHGDYQGIRPAMGYPMLPDQLLNKDIIDILEPESSKRVMLTENGAMSPSSTVSGLYIAHPDSRYFVIGDIGDDQIEDYARRRSMSPERIKDIMRQ